jgi:hypothetical protein
MASKSIALPLTSMFNGVDVIQYDKMRGVSIEITRGEQSCGMLFNDARPEEVIKFCQQIIEFVKVKDYPLVYQLATRETPPLVIKSREHEEKVIKKIDTMIEARLIGPRKNRMREATVLNNLRNRIKRGQELTHMQRQSLFVVMEELSKELR